MVISCILVACSSRLVLIYAISVLCCKFCLNLHIWVTLNMYHRVNLLVFDRSYVPRVVSTVFNPPESSVPPSIKLDLLLDQLTMNILVREASLRFWVYDSIRTFDERLSLDLLRGRGKSIGGELDIDDEGSEHNIEPLQLLHHYSIDYQSVQHELTSPRRLILTSAIENTTKNRE
jgi:hypothetical protein